MNQKLNKVISFSRSKFWKEFLERGISITSDIITKLENNPKFLNHYYHKHFNQLEEVKINGKTIFVAPKSSSYQIRKIVDNDKITYEIEN